MRIKILVIAGMMNMGIFYNSGLAKDSAIPMVVGCRYGMTISDEIRPKSVREKLSMDFDWRFVLGHASDIDKDFDYWGGDPAGNAKTGDPAGPANPGFSDKDWQIIDIPHDWVVGLDYNQSAEERHAYKEIGRRFPQNSIGWYRKTFKMPKEELGKRITIEFDGIFRDSKVWLNGHPMISHESGYTSFSFDVSDYLNYGSENTITVRADATGYELWSWEGAGIYRHARMVKTNPLHVAKWGTYIKSNVKMQGNKASAELDIETTIKNQQDDASDCQVTSVIFDPAGKKVAQVSSGPKSRIKGWSEAVVNQKVKIDKARLWSLEDPALYKMFTTVKQSITVVDTYETTFGIRTIKFDPDKGFFLNGKHVKIKGVCCHQDFGGVGVAIPDAVQDFKIKRLKEMGANGLRVAHNWVAPEALDACDEQGFLVMNEARMSGSTEELIKQLTDMVRRDRNHPSVIIWCLGNEEHVIQKNVIGQRIMKSMKRAVHMLDTTRSVTLAVHGGDGGPVNESLDILGCNYIPLGNLDNLHVTEPDKPIFVSEASCTSTVRGNYERDEMNRSTGYDDGAYSPGWGQPAESMWKYVASRDYLAGTFVWTGFDYGGEPGAPWPCVHTDWGGMMDRTGFAKDNYYYYQSWWSDKTVLHLFPHWNWTGKEGQDIWIWAHSNCDEIELIVNGQSMGKKKMEQNSHLEWYAKYEPGYIEARGYKNGQRVATSRRETTGAPASIRLRPDRTTINADNQDVSLVTVEIVDNKGRVVPTAGNTINFTIENGGDIIGICNGDPACHVPENQTIYPAFNGLLMVYVKAGFQAGPVTLKAWAQSLEPASVTISAVECNVKPYLFTSFEGSSGMTIVPAGGYFSDFDNVTVTMTVPSKHVRLRYTLDGSEPDNDSVLYKGPFKLTGPCIVKARIFIHTKGVGDIVTAEFKQVNSLFKTEVIRRVDEAQFIKMSVSGAKELILVVEDGGDSYDMDHADWADAKLIDIDGKVVYLSSLKPIRQSQGWGELGIDVSVQGNRLRINGREFSHGLGTHSQGELVFGLENKYEYFETWVGVDDEAGQEGSVQFKVITK
jgi:beta-galactosidase